MPQEVSWGFKLTPEELKQRNRLWEDRCKTFENDVSKGLGGLAKSVRVEWIHPVCQDCPERPHECAICRVDADMNGHFLKPGLRIMLEGGGEHADHNICR